MKQTKIVTGIVLATTIGLGAFSTMNVSAAEVEKTKMENVRVQVDGHVMQSTMKVNHSYMLSGEVVTVIHGNSQHIKLKRKEIRFTQPGTYVIQAKGCLGTVDTYLFKITK
ncbi:hypothetical protein CUC43_33730 (plasmid) [Bacillus thuringiensis LM1212]|uniref:hypothetical protein n=1 Tax=Bacillus cereus group TaxID=86661 RepID=UPI000E59BB4A|nr:MULTISPECIES: hypothetical protein [Bacillus cereus group]AXY11538.1 hypothetical protein CUC43_33730 [Bacillus thuringiensis LM1212]QDF27217.1 hypothetical protein FJR70_30980 [Bacillus tropicus]QUG99253.1 hypothetical protein HCM98_31050 [Bacillus tropicus]